MQEHAESIAKVLSTTTYGISGGLVLGDYISIIDQHSWIIGLGLGAITYTTNLVFRVIALIYNRKNYAPN
jgi:hypothetical protein